MNKIEQLDLLSKTINTASGGRNSSIDDMIAVLRLRIDGTPVKKN